MVRLSMVWLRRHRERVRSIIGMIWWSGVLIWMFSDYRTMGCEDGRKALSHELYDDTIAWYLLCFEV